MPVLAVDIAVKPPVGPDVNVPPCFEIATITALLPATGVIVPVEAVVPVAVTAPLAVVSSSPLVSNPEYSATLLIEADEEGARDAVRLIVTDAPAPHSAYHISELLPVKLDKAKCHVQPVWVTVVM